MRSKQTTGLSLAALVLLPALALGATPLPSGPPIHVNVSQHGRHFGPKAAVFPDGGFVVVWTNGPVSGGRSVLHSRLFAADGSPASGEFRLTEPALGSQTAEDVAADRDGSFLVAWKEERSPGGPTDVFVRRFSRDVTPAGARSPVNVPVPLSRFGAHLATGPGGQFAVAWTADDFTTDAFTDAVARRFTANGRPLGPEILADVGEPFAGESGALGFASGVALQPDGTLYVLFQDRTDVTQTLLVGYPPSGTPHGSELGLPGLPSVGAALAIAPDGHFIGVWEGFEVLGQRLDSHGVTLGRFFTVPKRQYDFEIYSGVAALADGGFVTTWVSPFGPAPTGGVFLSVFARVWNADGTPASRDFQLSFDVDGSPAVAAGGNGKGPVVVVWSQHRSDLAGDVYARLLTSR
jgi:hypothetical protein